MDWDFTTQQAPSSFFHAKITSGIQVWGYSGQWNRKRNWKKYLAFKLSLFGAKNNYLITGNPPCRYPVRLWGHHWWETIIWVLPLSPSLFRGTERIEAHTTWKPFRSVYREYFFPATDVQADWLWQCLVWWERLSANKLIFSVALINDAVIITGISAVTKMSLIRMVNCTQKCCRDKEAFLFMSGSSYGC